MKSLKFLHRLVVVAILCIALLTEAHAQDKSDVVVMLNGDQKEGKVTGISDNTVKFVYTGEDLEYELSTAEISKIEFASGREQVFNTVAEVSAIPVASAQNATSTAEERSNKIAVLPFDFTTNDPSIQVEPMRTRMQTACANSLSEHTSIVNIQPPMTTNAILYKNNITNDNVRLMSPQDMAIMLGVEYVVYGAYDLVYEGTMTSGSEVTTYKDKEQKDRDGGDSKKKASGSAVSSNSSYTTVEYDARVDMSIYDDKGNSVYSDSRKPFSADVDSYNISINYMVKRTPWGSKHK